MNIEYKVEDFDFSQEEYNSSGVKNPWYVDFEKVLNNYAKDGWILKSIIPMGNREYNSVSTSVTYAKCVFVKGEITLQDKINLI